METKTLQAMERQIRTLTQDFRYLRTALNAYLSFASLKKDGASAEGDSWSRRELEASFQQLEEHLQAFALLLFDRKLEDVGHAA